MHASFSSQVSSREAGNAAGSGSLMLSPSVHTRRSLRKVRALVLLQASLGSFHVPEDVVPEVFLQMWSSTRQALPLALDKLQQDVGALLVIH